MKNYIYLLLLLPMMVMGQSPSENYIKKSVYTADDNTTKNDNVTYYDGLGREKQLIEVAKGGQGQDVIVPIIYDQYGRKTRDYLPYANALEIISSPNIRNNSSLINSLNNYYASKYPSDQPISFNPYTEKNIELSPLNRILEQSAPGNTWKLDQNTDTDKTIKISYLTNSTSDLVNLFSVGYDELGKHFLKYGGRYPTATLYKQIVKDENWKPSQTYINDNSTHKFFDKDGNMVLQRKFDKNVPHDTYYVYDDLSNLAYVIPPGAADQIVYVLFPFSIVGVSYPWTSLTRVDKKLSDAYQKELMSYENYEILNLDLMDKYGGQGGFSLSTNTEGGLVLNLNITTAEPLELRTGEIVDLTPYGSFPDKEQGYIKGADYEYYFTIRKNRLMVEGYGKVPSIVLNQSFNGSTPMEYVKNYPWTSFSLVDPEIAKRYEDMISKLDNSEILSVYTDNVYNASGGLSISVAADDTVSLSLNVATGQNFELASGTIIPLETKRRLEDMDLGSIKGQGFEYSFSIKENSLHIFGKGFFENIQFFSSRTPKPTLKIRQTVLEGLCYIYRHDGRERVIEKKVPGRDWQSIIYDALDRPVLTQDGNQKEQGKWSFTKYDFLNRVVYTGLYSDPQLRTRELLQAYVDGLSSPISETKSTASLLLDNTLVYYTNSVFPQSGLEMMSVSYYDNYTFNTENIVRPVQNFYGVVTQSQPKQLLTGLKTKVLTSGQWITTIIAYDTKQRSVWSETKNSYLGVNEKLDIKFDFTGKILESRTIHLRPSSQTNITLIDKYSYDNGQRLTKHTQKINAGIEKLIVWNRYDELGQLIQKKVGGNPSTSFQATSALQTVDYTYNIRCWLTGINSVDSFQNSDALFAYKVGYNTSSVSQNANIYYNGNITETQWITKQDNNVRKYTYEYDALSRLKNAVYYGHSLVGTTTTQVENYNESASYDKNGNIIGLKRYGLRSNAQPELNIIDLIDDLQYTYEPYSNRLRKVTDNASHTDGFIEGTNMGDDYTYDLNGNMTKDLNKKIGSETLKGIEYNHLNLPSKIIFASGSLEFVYDAMGRKVQKKMTVGGVVTTVDYTGLFVYNNNRLESFSHDEGYVRKETNDTYSYVYQYKDQLGNIRLSYCDNNNDNVISTSEIISENHYYPFGMRHRGYNTIMQSSDIALNFMYNNKEYYDDLGINMYDYGARMYMPDLGRWGVSDPAAEYSYDYSPYCFSYNDPVAFLDKDGEMPGPVGFIIGAFADYISQVAYNYYVHDLPFKTSLTYDINVASIGVSGFTGAFTGGLDSLKGVMTSKFGSRILNEVIEFGFDFVVNLIQNVSSSYMEEGTVDFWKAITGALLEPGIGKLLPSKYVDKLQAKLLKNQDKAARKMAYHKRKMDRARRLETKKKHSKKYNEADKKHSYYENAHIGVKTVHDAYKKFGANALTNELFLFLDRNKTTKVEVGPLEGGIIEKKNYSKDDINK